MKKILLLLLLIIVTGCSMSSNTPTGSVENYLNKYQNLDKEVLNQLDNVLIKNSTMTEKQRNNYKDLMINQYKNMSYKVKEENILSDNEAEVEVEIEVLDYASSINESKIYYRNHYDEFESDIYNEKLLDNISSFIDYKLENMKNVEKKVKYNIIFSLVKIDNQWIINDLDDIDIQKIHGLYDY